MDHTVKKLENYSESKITQLKYIEIALFFISILIILLEFFLIFRPIETILNQSIFELKQKNTELQYISQQLQEKNQEIQEFNFITAHDLQEPVRTIGSFSGLLIKRYSNSLDNNGIIYLKLIEQSSQKMSLQLHSLIHYAQIGKQKNAQTLDLNILLDDVIAHLQPIIMENKAQIIRHNTLPTTTVYNTEFKSLLQNLIINAIKYRSNDLPIIDILYQKITNQHQFIIKDNGIGIEEKYREKVFKMFQKLHQNQHIEGIGVGLAYCKKIVNLHGGKIWIETNQPKGAQFIFTIDYQATTS